MSNSIRVLMQYRPGYPQTSSAVQDAIWVDISKRVDYSSLQWDQQATEQNTSFRFDIFSILPLSTTRYDDYASWATHGTNLDANTGTSLGMADAINDPSFFIDVASRTEVKVEEWELVGGSYQVVKSLWGGVVSAVDTERQGDSFTVQRVECSDYTALLDEMIIRDYNAPTVSESLSERATISGLTTDVIAGGATLTAGAYTFRVVAYDASGEILDIFTHITQNISATDVTPPGISGTVMRTIRLDWTAVAGASTYKVFAKSGIGTKDLYLKTTISAPTVTYSMSTAPAVSGDKSPEDRVQKGSIDIDVIKGSTDSENANYKGIFNAIDPGLDPGINNQTAYVETAKKLTDGSPDPEKSYRFSPTLETGIVLTSPFGGKTLKQALSMITEKTGSVFWIDANKDLHYTNKQARELLENPRFESSPASTGYSVGANHSVIQDRGPYGYGRALIASSAAGTTVSKTDATPVTASGYYFARVRGWAASNFSGHWNAELVFYSNAEGTTQTGSSYPLQRTSSFSSTDEARWCKTWAMAQAPANAVSARIVANKKIVVAAEVGWTDFSIVKITGTSGFSDLPSETAYALPMRPFETPKAPRSASKVANRLLVYGVYKSLKNPSELESTEVDASLTLRKIQAGSLPAGKYYVRVVAVVDGEDIICAYATETLTDQDFLDGNKELLASWGAVAGASSYKIYVGTKRFAMRLKTTQAGTTLSIQTPAPGGAPIAPEPEVYYYKVFDFSPGIWESGGKIVEASINDSLVDNDEKAQTRAIAFWEEKGIAERTWEFDTFSESVPAVGDVIPFVWSADDTAQPLMVKGVKGRLYGDRVYYTVTVGDDPLLAKRGVTQIFADIQMAIARLNDVIAPAAVVGLVLASSVNDLIQTPDGTTRANVTAQWVPSPEDDFSHYTVEYGYDALFIEAQRAIIGQTSDSQSSSTGIKANVVHTFQADSGRTLYYRVCAVDATNNRSQWVEDEVVLPSDETPCDAPTALNVNTGFKTNTLSWSFNFYNPSSPLLYTGNTDFSRFRIYRRAHNVGSYAVIAETSATQYIDTDFASYDTGYNYAVTSLDRTGNESGVPASGGAAGVAYNTSENIPDRITGSIDIADASITAAKISELSAASITTGTFEATRISGGTLTAIAIDNGSGTFGVTSAGVLTATSGTMGGYTIAADRLTNASTTGSVKYAGLIDTAADTGLALFAGATSTAGASAAFSVTNAGEVTASNLIVTGGSIDFGNVTAMNLSANSITTGTLSATRISGGTFDASTMTVQNLSASSITTGTLSASRISGGTLSGITLDINSRLQVDSSGNLTSAGAYFNPADGGPAITLAASAAEGDIAVPSGNALSVGFVTGNSFTEAWRMTSGGVIDAMSGLSVSGSLTLPAGSITSTMLAADSVTSTKIAAGAVQAAAIDNDAVTSTKILAGAVGQTELSSTAIFKTVTPATTPAVNQNAAGWTSTTGAASLRRLTGTVTSERAFKSDISAIAPETDKYELLNWITFRYDAQKMRDYGLVSAGIDYEVSDKKNWGLIADELQELFPEAVVLEQTDEGSFRGINYQTLRAIEGMVIKDLIGRVKSLETRIAELEG